MKIYLKTYVHGSTLIFRSKYKCFIDHRIILSLVIPNWNLLNFFYVLTNKLFGYELVLLLFVGSLTSRFRSWFVHIYSKIINFSFVNGCPLTYRSTISFF